MKQSVKKDFLEDIFANFYLIQTFKYIYIVESLNLSNKFLNCIVI